MSSPLRTKDIIITLCGALFIIAGLALLVWHGELPPFPPMGIPFGQNSPTPSATSTIPDYIEIIDGCGPYYDTGTCVNMRSGPDTSFPVVARLRTGVVLKVAPTTTVSTDGRLWYSVVVDPHLVHPERVTSNWYIAADPESILPLSGMGDEYLTKQSPPTNKYIIVNLQDETLVAYEGDEMFIQVPISTGLDSTPTKKGVYYVFKKTPSRYMQGPIPGGTDQYYDLPGVPWNLYFTADGAVIHGAYWHDHFGKPWSHGCVNLSPEIARALYDWAPVGTKVIVQTH